jgi:arginyl-tRNA synthetase
MFSSLSNTVQQAIATEFGIDDISVGWERPQDSAHGDLATPIALQISKKVGKSPKEIAKTIVAALTEEKDIERAEIAGPGYANIWLTPAALVAALGSTRQACTAKVKSGAPVIVEYSQPNIAKPLGAHHLLTTLFGQSIANIYEHLGYEVIKWNYMGDWGTQFGKLSVAVSKWGDGRAASQYSVDELLDLYVKFHSEAENDDTLEDQARVVFKKLEDGDTELQAFWRDIITVTKSALSGIYEQLHVSFDTDKSESFYEDKMDPILETGIASGVFKEGEGGSLIVEFPEESNMPPYLVRKGDGATLYSTRDIAQMRYRMEELKPREILIVTDIAQKLHFEQLAATCEQLGWDITGFENVLVGRMRYADKSMSTRKGNVLKLNEVLREAVKKAEEKIKEHGNQIQSDDPAELAKMMGIGAVSYGIVSQNRKQDIVFDWDKMLSFEGNSAPYLQYTHARARSVVAKAGEVIDPKQVESLTEKERGLLNTLLKFERVLEEARKSKMPHILANFLFELCQDYNSFYNDNPILKAEEPVRTFRIHLTLLTADVLKTGAGLLTISVPDRM